MEKKKYEVLITIRRNGEIHKVGELVELPKEMAKKFLEEDIICEPGNTEKAELRYSIQDKLKAKNEKLNLEIVELKKRLEENPTKNTISDEEIQNLQGTITFLLEKENLEKMEKSLLEKFALYINHELKGETKKEIIEELLETVMGD